MLLSARRLFFSVLAAVLGVLVLASASALAAAPETPEVSVQLPASATSVTVHGVLDPGVEGAPGTYELGTYEFLYKQGKAGCEGEGKAPASPGISLGGGKEAVTEVLSGLTPNTEYTVCLLARTGVKGEDAVSLPATFRTALPPETPITTGPAGSITATSAKLEGMLNPGGKGEPGSYEFVYRQSTSECQHENVETQQQESEHTPTEVALGGEKEVVSPVEVSGLLPNMPYTFCLLARNEAGETALGSPVTFSTLSHKPSVSSTSFSSVGSADATVNTQVETGGLETTIVVKYGTSSAYGSETTAVKLAAGTSTGTTQLLRLQPNTEYHFRVTITNQDGSETSPTDTAFTTLPTGIQGLPDKRAYEMVTPIDKEDAEIYVPDAVQPGNQAEGYQTTRLTEVAPNGDAVVYQGDPTHNGAAGGGGNGLGSAYRATRSPAGGWTQVGIQPTGRRYTYYRGFSTDLSVGVLMAPTENPEADEAQLPGGNAPVGSYGGAEYHERSDLYRHAVSEEDYQALYTAIPNRAPYEFGGVAFDGGFTKVQGEPAYAGGSANLTNLLFEANDALLEGNGALEEELTEDARRELANGEVGADYLYDWAARSLSLVDVLPDGHVVPNTTFGAPQIFGTKISGNPPNFSHVISVDGSRIFWTALEGEGSSQEPKALYVRENATQPQSPLNGQDECTVPVDACTVQVDKEVGGGGRFWAASSDGAKVFFTKGGLYEYAVNPTIGQPGVLTSLTPGVEVQGVIGVSEDGDYLYYVDSNSELYMLHDNGGKWEAPVSIAKLSPEDGTEIEPFAGLTAFIQIGEGHAGDWVPDVGQRTAEVTPNGQGLVFMSDQNLKAQGFPNWYKNEGGEEVYVYDAAQNSVYCASCSQSGEAGANGFLPISWSDSYIPTLISEDGDRVFFDSSSALVSRDTNGVMDAYEWEREGTGSCGQGDGAYGGCIYLLSGGSGNEPSWLLGASSSGNDVFMITRADLTSDAQDELYKVFDARVEGVEPLAPPACTGTGCQGVPGAPPIFATPSSVTYDGVGNFLAPAPVKETVKPKAKPLTLSQKLTKALKVCKGKPKKKRASCEALARKRYKPIEKDAKSPKMAKRVSDSKRGGK